MPRNERATDAELLARIRAGEPDALASLYDRYASYVTGVATKIIGERASAEDVTQDVFWQIWRRRLEYDPARARFTTWLFTVARNRSLDRVRATRRVMLEPIESVRALPAAIDIEVDVELARSRERVKRALAELAPEQRDAIEMNFYRGLSHLEIAEAIGAPLGTVKSRIKRGMARLAIALDAGEET